MSRLGVRAGEQWLDLATGTGAVATLAARQGAVVTGLDLAPKLIETARRLAAENGLEITYEVGDCEDVPHPGASFDAVSSAMGVIAAPDHAAVARELTRVCKPGGRIGIAAWSGSYGTPVTTIMAKYTPPAPEGVGIGTDWGRRDYATSLFEPRSRRPNLQPVGPTPETTAELIVRLRKELAGEGSGRGRRTPSHGTWDTTTTSRCRSPPSAAILAWAGLVTPDPKKRPTFVLHSLRGRPTQRVLAVRLHPLSARRRARHRDPHLAG